MPVEPPLALVELIERLGVATSAQILQAGRPMRRIGRNLLECDAVWIDALVRARRLTPFQSREINAGRGAELRIGPYLLCEKLEGMPYLASYRAKHRDTGAIVRLCVRSRTGLQPLDLSHRQNSFSEIRNRQVGNLSYDHFDSGVEGQRLFFASPWTEGRTVAQWLTVNGRFSSEMVLEIARLMIAELAALEKAGRCHGDIAAWNLLLTPEGDTVWLHAGMRAIVRPAEGFALADLLPEAYDYLAPERVTAGTPPNISSDVYACGCLWWQMLCGRPPLGGGDSLAKLRAAEVADIPAVRRFALETPAILADVISACLQKDPSRRPESMAKLALMLGAASKDSRQFVARTIAAKYQNNRTGNNRFAKLAPHWPVALTAAIGCISVMLLLVGPILQTLLEKTSSKKTITRQQGTERRETHDKQVKSSSYRTLDRQVQPAGYVEEKSVTPPRLAVPDYLLNTETPQILEKLSLQHGQRAVGKSGRRAKILVPSNGLKIEGEEVRLENIDFIWHEKGTPVTSGRNAAMLLFSGSRAEFRSCRFLSSTDSSARPAVLHWTDGKDEESKSALPSGRLQLRNCVFHRVGVGIECRRRGAIALDMKNCFVSHATALFRLDHQPEIDEPIFLDLAQLTLRETGSLLCCRRSPSEKPPGEIVVRAERCVFAPRKNDPLLAFEGIDPPDALLRNIRWDGSGSLLDAESAVSAWKTPAGNWEPLDDTTLSIAGLVRSRLEFAENAENDENPVQSARLRHWQAPLPSLDPPGVDIESLPK